MVLHNVSLTAVERSKEQDALADIRRAVAAADTVVGAKASTARMLRGRVEPSRRHLLVPYGCSCR